MNKNTQIIIGLLLLAGIIGFSIWFSKNNGGMNTMNPEQETGLSLTDLSVIEKLTSTSWVWQKTVMNDDTTIEPMKSGAFSLTFTADGNVSGTTDCNNFFGAYTLTDTKIVFGPLASTMMFCENSQESVFTRSLENIDSVFFDTNGNLVLLIKYDSGSILFAPQSSQE